jgi:hypothetical protein
LLKPSLVKISHLWASLPVMGLMTNPIYASEAFLPMSFPLSTQELSEGLRAIRPPN